MSLSVKAQQRIAAIGRDLVSHLSATLVIVSDYTALRGRLNAEQRAALDEILPPAQVQAAVTMTKGKSRRGGDESFF